MALPNRHQLSAEGVMSDEYRVWKEETLAKQTGHREAVQTTGLWQQFNQVQVGRKERDWNNFEIELAQGYRYANTIFLHVHSSVFRMVPEGEILASWSCPKWKGEIRVIIIDEETQ